MRALADAGYTTVTGDALVDHLAHGAPLSHKPLLLTFRRRLGGAVHARPARAATPPLRRDLLRHDRHAWKARLAHAPAGANAGSSRHDDRSPHLGSQGRHGLQRRRLARRADRPDAGPREAGRTPPSTSSPTPTGCTTARRSRICAARASPPPSNSPSASTGVTRSGRSAASSCPSSAAQISCARSGATSYQSRTGT